MSIFGFTFGFTIISTFQLRRSLINVQGPDTEQKTMQI